MNAPAISQPTLQFFRGIVRRYFRRHFHGVRVSGAQQFVTAGAGKVPLIVYANHGSWWDPMVSICLADRLMPGRRHYAPMDAEALQRYGILRKVGIFPVESKTSRGAVQFLRTGEAVLLDGGVLWVTPQGQFVDARARPLEFKPGLAALATRVASSVGECVLLPLAIEYAFWDERLPECLLEFGHPVRVIPSDDAAALQLQLISALEVTMDELKSKAMLRNSEGFEELVRGRSGTGGFYALMQRTIAVFLRRPYRREHTAAAISTPPEAEKGKRQGA
jgi:1-acyl-sn-glycerol-3-phosphate acyltransferase